ncbi:DUF4142 domain-containing protein [Pyxidicoccus fallax]|uniref:DUF4142 domain-containing protein n=1 Tax=Pyxidicoccus fallax TaxID=394095 RepID=A0A848LE14_9BACT|nr:DUF4142 domain-containing protein [Pyxidicoccus fallax]NMO15043.1 DUF4142 domain-containing protein [Pyxidicoccus fallax]NPC78065.1 DUF4142 domain-containing protein [Pyxidicoccus fallax]
MHTKRSWMGAVLVSALLVLGAGCDDDDNNGDTPPPEAAPEVQDLTLSDAQIVRVLVVANEGEVMLGQLGQQRATSAEVRDFNARMVTEHTEAQQRLEQLAQDQGLVPEDSAVSQQLQDEVQRMMETLEAAPADTFDLAMMGSQVAAHARTAMTGDALLMPQVQNTALRQELMTLRRSVQEHLEEGADIHSDLADTLP